MLKIGIPLAILGTVAWYALNKIDGNPLGGVATPDGGNAFIVAYGYLMTVLGVLLGSAYRQLEKLRALKQTQIESFSAMASDVARSIDLWMSLMASPIVFALIWKTMDRTSYSSVTIVALENGFACLAVVTAFLKRKGGPAKR
jgi:hypothetical protein